jgi:hypothetical protein
VFEASYSYKPLIERYKSRIDANKKLCFNYPMLIKIMIVFSLPFLLFSCSSEEHVSASELKELRVGCLRDKEALDCAQVAYYMKDKNPTMAAEYNKRACALGEDSACFNNSHSDKSAIQKNMALLQGKSTDMFACYYDAAGETRRNEDLDEKDTKNIRINVKVGTSGEVTNVSVEKNQIESEAFSCIKKIINTIRFVPSKNLQSLDYSLTVPRAYL